MTLERLPESRVQLEIEVDQDRVDRHVEAAYRRLAARARVPGFRPGKAPRQMIERVIGRDKLMAEALDKIVPEAYNEAIKQEKFDAIAQPTLNNVDLEPVRLKFIVPVKPTVDLGEYTAIRVAREPAEVKDEDIADQLLSIRRRNAIHAPVERGVAWDDALIASVHGMAGDEEFVNDDDAEFTLREASVLLVPGLGEAFLGMKRDDTKTVDILVPDDFRTERFRGQTVTFTLAVKEVKEEQLPDEDDELAMLVNAEEFETLDALKERIRTDLLAEREKAAVTRYRETIVDNLVQAATIEYPAIMVEHEMDHMMNEMSGNDRQMYAMYLRNIGRTPEEYREMFRDAAVVRLKRSLALGQFTEAEGISATPEEVTAEIERIAAPMGDDAEKFREMFSAPEGVESIRRNLISQRTFDRLVAIATNGATDGASPAKAEEIAPAKKPRARAAKQAASKEEKE